MQRFITIIFLMSLALSFSNAQDKGTFTKSENAFWKEIKKSADEFKEKDDDESKTFIVDLEGYNLPKSSDDFTSFWHNDPISQGRTNTCWSFSTTSFFESEVYRIHSKKVKLSELWTAYWEFVEKAEGFIDSRGELLFPDGSESNAVTRVWKKYGVVPAEAYSGLLLGQTFPDQAEMFPEMKNYLEFVKENNIWNKEEVITTIKSILNHHMGTPPKKFNVDGKEYTPVTYLKDYLKINFSDYVEVLSIKQQPYYEQVEFEVPDNWWNNSDYYNVPLDEFMGIVKSAISKGYTMCIGGDVSEAGKVADYDIALIPSFDIPSEYINEDARQFRFSNETTTDDHGVHLVGYLEMDGDDWYLIKDSGSSSRNGDNKGYYFFHEDYVKLKMLGFSVHKDAMGDLLEKFDK